MNKKIVIIIIILILASFAFLSIKLLVDKDIENDNKTNNNITYETFNKLIDYEINSEEKIQIIDGYDPGVVDASFTTYYNIDLNEKNVVVLYRNSVFGTNPKTEYTKYEYNLTDEKIINIKQQIDLIEKEENDKINIDEKRYTITTNNGKKEFSIDEKIQPIKNIISLIK